MSMHCTPPAWSRNPGLHQPIDTQPPRCLELAKRGGWKVYATARDPRKVQELEGVPNIFTRTLDVTQDEQVASVVAGIVEAEGRIDCIVNNAGGISIGVCDPPLFPMKSSRTRASSGPVVDATPSAALSKPEPFCDTVPASPLTKSSHQVSSIST
jgi:NAD(P)-dependent dehydrogenase (short-subunit alcohol dehydrogenase family)